MECKRCGYNFIGEYCTRCIIFGKYKNEKIEVLPRGNMNGKYFLEYQLTKEQEQIAYMIASRNADFVIDAVCGAGKTEMVLPIISKYLRLGKRVGFVIPRKEIVKDVGERLQNIFKDNDVSLVYGGSETKTIGDLTVLTAHQAFRFTECFELVIIDEIDAFPYHGNSILQDIVIRTKTEQVISMTATLSGIKTNDARVLKLNKRYHEHIHPIPKVVTTFFVKKRLKKLLLNMSKVIVYFPTIKQATDYYESFKSIFNIDFICSKTSNTNRIFTRFKRGEISQFLQQQH